ncbi:MAG: PIN domain-containing protein, partial [Candidatus Diapherotrites archaeon]|nr:PIN domain-containing protein [Candidatus Diapherotrites archaeon]
MKETVSKIVVDSSAWIDYFFTGNKKITEIIESENFLVCSAISLHEVKKKLLREKYSEEEISTALKFMKENRIVADVSEEICEKSATDSINLMLNKIDSII